VELSLEISTKVIIDKSTKIRARGMVQVVEYLPSKSKALGSSRCTAKEIKNPPQCYKTDKSKSLLTHSKLKLCKRDSTTATRFYLVPFP
jgi:hypothetical protein